MLIQSQYNFVLTFIKLCYVKIAVQYFLSLAFISFRILTILSYVKQYKLLKLNTESNRIKARNRKPINLGNRR